MLAKYDIETGYKIVTILQSPDSAYTEKLQKASCVSASLLCG